MARATQDTAAFFVATLLLWFVSVVFEIAFNKRRELLALIAGCCFYQIANSVIRFSLSRDPLFVNTSVSLLHSTVTSASGIWWNLCGHALPNLRELAIKVLSQPCSASACERNWSVFEAVHTKKRNRLEPGKLHDLVYVKLNLHLQMTSKEIHAKDSTPICIENLEAFPSMTVGDDPNVVNIEDDEDDELGDSEEEEDVFENIDFLNPSI